ncbi:MAG: HAD family hydrolase [Pseudomonadota bacterium]
MTTRIAMWSGPRNISTAMMRAWENRPDTHVIDEPFYAHYLKTTGIDHPMREAVIASQPNDWGEVVADITGPGPGGASIWYQKHMTHHMIPEVDRDWFRHVRHAFLIRDPSEMLASYAAKRTSVTPADLGAELQAELYDEVVERTGQTPPVIDAADVLRSPEAMLRSLCDALEVPFDDAMMAWPQGPRPTDGVWSAHWYANVEASTGFRSYEPKTIDLPDNLEAIAEICRAPYRRLWRQRLLV